jgi:hypothetical protein
MRKSLKRTIIVGGLITFLIAVLAITNFTILNRYLPQPGPFNYCSNQCDFSDFELVKGHNRLAAVELHFYQYKVRKRNDDYILYRRFELKWWQFWNWYDFLTERRWTYPYASSDEDN